MRSKTRDLLEQRVQAVIDRFPETRNNDSALVFRVLLLYGAAYDMAPSTLVGLPSLVDILSVRSELLDGEADRTAT